MLLDVFGLEIYFCVMDGDVLFEEYDCYYDEQGGCIGWILMLFGGDGW